MDWNAIWSCYVNCIYTNIIWINDSQIEKFHVLLVVCGGASYACFNRAGSKGVSHSQSVYCWLHLWNSTGSHRLQKY